MLRHSGIRELEWAQHFALLNREEMMDRVVRQYSEWAGEPVIEQERINCHHNYTERLPASQARSLFLPAEGVHKLTPSARCDTSWSRFSRPTWRIPGGARAAQRDLRDASVEKFSCGVGRRAARFTP